jgi:hypothetical protein
VAPCQCRRRHRGCGVQVSVGHSLHCTLDPIAATCAYAIDIKLSIVRGGSRVSGRRLLGVEEHADGGASGATIPCAETRCSLCCSRKHAAPAPRRCAAANHTIAVLGLSRALPPCTLCSLTDVTRAAHRNPIGVLNLLVHAPVVLARHGPFADAAVVFSAILDAVRKSVSVLEADPRPLIFLGSDGAPHVGAHIVDEGILPAEVVLVIEKAMRFISRAATRAGAAPRSATPASRHLLFFREIIDTVSASGRGARARDDDR